MSQDNQHTHADQTTMVFPGPNFRYQNVMNLYRGPESPLRYAGEKAAR